MSMFTGNVLFINRHTRSLAYLVHAHARIYTERVKCGGQALFCETWLTWKSSILWTPCSTMGCWKLSEKVDSDKVRLSVRPRTYTSVFSPFATHKWPCLYVKRLIIFRKRRLKSIQSLRKLLSKSVSVYVTQCLLGGNFAGEYFKHCI